MNNLIFRVRPFFFMFMRNWYSLERWNYGSEYEGYIYKIIDFGSFSLGYRKKIKF